MHVFTWRHFRLHDCIWWFYMISIDTSTCKGNFGHNYNLEQRFLFKIVNCGSSFFLDVKFATDFCPSSSFGSHFSCWRIFCVDVLRLALIAQSFPSCRLPPAAASHYRTSVRMITLNRSNCKFRINLCLWCLHQLFVESVLNFDILQWCYFCKIIKIFYINDFLQINRKNVFIISLFKDLLC